MSRLAWMAVGAVVTLGACAYPDFVFNGSTGTGASSTTATTSGTGGKMSTCKVISPGDGTCEYLPGKECGCSGPTPKCTVIDPSTGETGCVTAGATADYDACSSTTDCKNGSWCELSTSVCEPICDGTCSGGVCLLASQQNTGTQTIPGLDVCSASCDLVTGAPCGANATCVTATDSTGATIAICFKSGGAGQGMPCASPQDCAAGGVCTQDPITSSTDCSQWCRDGEDPCPAMGEICHNFQSPSVSVGGHDYGYCGP